MTFLSRPSVVVDTTVVSYIHRGEAIARQYMNRMVGHRTVISFQTYEEILFGVQVSNWGRRRVDDLIRYVDETYDVAGYDIELVKACARLRADSRRRGRELTIADAWIAATAVLLNCPILSHDRDFGGLPDLQVIRFD